MSGALRASALALAGQLRGNPGEWPKPGEAATMIEALVALLDGYTPIIELVNHAGDEAIQRTMRIVERQERLDIDSKVGSVLPHPDGRFISRHELIEELLYLNGYLEDDEVAEAMSATPVGEDDEDPAG